MPAINRKVFNVSFCFLWQLLYVALFSFLMLNNKVFFCLCVLQTGNFDNGLIIWRHIISSFSERRLDWLNNAHDVLLESLCEAHMHLITLVEAVDILSIVLVIQSILRVHHKNWEWSCGGPPITICRYHVKTVKGNIITKFTCYKQWETNLFATEIII